MRRIVLCCAILLGGMAIPSLPKDADACSVCDTDRPRCNPAVNFRCSTYAYSKTLVVCEQYATSCAYAYNPAEISVDGSIVRVAASLEAQPDAEQVRGCHGLIVDRAYTRARQAQARALSQQIEL